MFLLPISTAIVTWMVEGTKACAQGNVWKSRRYYIPQNMAPGYEIAQYTPPNTIVYLYRC